MLLSALVKRFGVSRMQEFFKLRVFLVKFLQVVGLNTKQLQQSTILTNDSDVAARNKRRNTDVIKATIYG